MDEPMKLTEDWNMYKHLKVKLNRPQYHMFKLMFEIYCSSAKCLFHSELNSAFMRFLKITFRKIKLPVTKRHFSNTLP